ncbi:unnamed protein product [Ectocarpus fasciculatus]
MHVLCCMSLFGSVAFCKETETDCPSRHSSMKFVGGLMCRSHCCVRMYYRTAAILSRVSFLVWKTPV